MEYDTTGRYTFSDVLDPEKLQALTEDFHDATGLSACAVNPDGEFIAGVDGQEICSRFHRKSETTEPNCLKSYGKIKEYLASQKPHILYKCPNGLYDVAAPVTVGGRPVAVLFTGQFLLFRPDISDIEQFSSRARAAGFNETAYLNALEKVPTLTPARLDEIIKELKQFIGTLKGKGSPGKARGHGRCDDARGEKCMQLAKKTAGGETPDLSGNSEKRGYAPNPPALQALSGKSPARSAAHDFNNVLSTIIGYSELLMLHAEKGSRLENGLAKIHAAGNQARELVSHVFSGSPSLK